MRQLIKKIIYQVGMGVKNVYWSLMGRRHSVFGVNLSLVRETVFPDFWNLRLPVGGAKSKIVKYGDFVQMHSMVDFIARIDTHVTIIDVGAHHGAYAIVLGKILQRRKLGGRIIAIEPNPVSYSVLKANIDRNGLEQIIFCEQIAVSEKAGMMNISLRDVQSGLTADATIDTMPVKVVTLDMLIEKYGITDVDLLQIDVEGAELPVLKSFPWGKIKIKKIFCEMHPYAWNEFGYSGQDLSEFLDRRRLRCFDMFFNEHTKFDGSEYIGPSLLFPCEGRG
jgi:FkbM family methyltransferase